MIQNKSIFHFSFIICVCVFSLTTSLNFISCSGSGTGTSATSTSCTAGAIWSTKDDYQLLSSQSSDGYAFGVDSSGNAWVAGAAYDSNSKSHWIARDSVDGGSTWTTKDDYQLAANQYGYTYAFGKDSSGNLWTAGSASDSNSKLLWIVRESTDGGSTWSTKDNYYLVSGQTAIATMFGQDSSGNLWIGGRAYASAGNAHWIVRKSTDGGSTWNTKDDYQLVSGQFSGATAFGKDSSNNIWVAGSTADSTAGHWIVRESTDGGSTWNTKDDYQLASGKGSFASAFAVDSSGNLWAAGFANDSNTVYHWIVRKSTDGGSTWITKDDYQLISGKGAIVKALRIDSSKNIWIAGYATDSNNANHWIVRESTDSGSTWNTKDDYSLVSGKNAIAYAFGIDSSGNLWTAGGATDSSGNDHWIVRKSLCQ